MNIAATAFATGTVSAEAKPHIPVRADIQETTSSGLAFDFVPEIYDVVTPSKANVRGILDDVVRKNIEAVLAGKNTNEEKLRALDQFIEDSLNRIASTLNG